MLSIIINLLLAVFVLVAILLVVVVLMQRPKSQGLGAAFGGGMTENMFGAQTSSILSKFTVVLAMLFFMLTLSLAILYARQTGDDHSAVLERLLKDYDAEAAEEAGVEPAPVVEEIIEFQTEEMEEEPPVGETMEEPELEEIEFEESDAVITPGEARD